MICRLIEGITLGAWQLACPAAPAAPWAYAAAIAGIAATLLLALRARTRALPLRILTTVLFALAFILLAVAAERPELRRSLDKAQGGKIVVLLDQSESFWRDPAQARGALNMAADRIESFLASMPDGQAAGWRGELRGFGRASGGLGGESAAAYLADTLRSYRVDRVEDASNLRAGLLDGLAALRDRDGQGRVILLSDGLASEAPDDTLWAEFRALGVPVDFIAAGTSTPASGLVAANLGPEHRIGQEAVLRGTTLGAGRLMVMQKERSDTLEVAGANTLRPLRLTTSFGRRGLQGLQLGFDMARVRQQCNLFTLVRGPARLLIYGPAPWVDALPEARWRVEWASPAAPLPPADYDLVVIDGLEPQDFPPGHVVELMAAFPSDPRFALRAPRLDEPVVLFKLPQPVARFEDVGDEFRNGLLQIALGCVVAQADGHVSPEEERALQAQLDDIAGLTEVERIRLKANLDWFLAVPPDMAQLRGRMKEVGVGQEENLRRAVVSVTHADGAVAAAEVAGVERIYRALDLAPTHVYSDLHAGGTLDEPVRVRAADPAPEAEAIPPARRGGGLDPERIAAIRADTARASAVLGQIFAAEPEAPEPPATDAPQALPGLDLRLSALLGDLIGSESWSEAGFSELVQRHGLMPAGALEALNEWAWNGYDEALIEEYDGYEVSTSLI